MIRAEFDFSENGLTAKGWFACCVTSVERREFHPVGTCHFQELFFKCSGTPDLKKIENICWEKAIPQIY